MPAFGTLKYPSLRDAFPVSNGYIFLTNITISLTFVEKVFLLGIEIRENSKIQNPI
jgi:hypothetical protein